MAAITGTIELPWIKQMLVRKEREAGILLRTRIYLMHEESSRSPLLLIQPRYFGREMAVHAKAIVDEIVRHLSSAYGQPCSEKGHGVCVRLMPDKMISHDIGQNTGYRTFSSGDSPFFYIDSNCHQWSFGENVVALNGLYSRKRDESVYFPKGWSSEFDALKGYKGR